jgi:hypothetical protein
VAPWLVLLVGGGGWVHQLVVQLLSSQAICMEQLAEVSDDLCFQISISPGLARDNTLDSLADLSDNSCILSSICNPGALECSF